MIVYLGILFDKRVRRGYDRPRAGSSRGKTNTRPRFGEELFEFSVELCRERLVMRHHNCWPLELLNDVGHGEGFTATGNTQECLRREPCTDSVYQLLYRAGLITGELV